MQRIDRQAFLMNVFQNNEQLPGANLLIYKKKIVTVWWNSKKWRANNKLTGGVDSGWNVMAHGAAGRGSEGETSEWSG